MLDRQLTIVGLTFAHFRAPKEPLGGSFARLRRAQGLSALGGGHKCPPEPPAPMTCSTVRLFVFERFSPEKIGSAYRIIWSSAYLALPLLLNSAIF